MTSIAIRNSELTRESVFRIMEEDAAFSIVSCDQSVHMHGAVGMYNTNHYMESIDKIRRLPFFH